MSDYEPGDRVVIVPDRSRPVFIPFLSLEGKHATVQSVRYGEIDEVFIKFDSYVTWTSTDAAKWVAHHNRPDLPLPVDGGEEIVIGENHLRKLDLIERLAELAWL
jgi:hypothetical protein